MLKAFQNVLSEENFTRYNIGPSNIFALKMRYNKYLFERSRARERERERERGEQRG